MSIYPQESCVDPFYQCLQYYYGPKIEKKQVEPLFHWYYTHCAFLGKTPFISSL